jgi:hypothetical protein
MAGAKMSVNRMMREIERRICVRELWRCSAGWGMMVILDPVPDEYRGREAQYLQRGAVTAYYDTVEACVRAEYRVWVKGLSRPSRQSKTIR